MLSNRLIDLTKLLNNLESELDVSRVLDYTNEDLENIDIEELKEVKVSGNIKKNEQNEIIIEVNVNGMMILLDSISLEAVEYPFSFEIDENLTEYFENNENTLDIYEFLWENIVLEVPLKFTKVKDLSEFHGDGWKLISEDEKSLSNNPFNDLLKKFKEE